MERKIYAGAMTALLKAAQAPDWTAMQAGPGNLGRAVPPKGALGSGNPAKGFNAGKGISEGKPTAALTPPGSPAKAIGIPKAALSTAGWPAMRSFLEGIGLGRRLPQARRLYPRVPDRDAMVAALRARHRIGDIPKEASGGPGEPTDITRTVNDITGLQRGTLKGPALRETLETPITPDQVRVARSLLKTPARHSAPPVRTFSGGPAELAAHFSAPGRPDPLMVYPPDILQQYYGTPAAVRAEASAAQRYSDRNRLGLDTYRAATAPVRMRSSDMGTSYAGSDDTVNLNPPPGRFWNRRLAGMASSGRFGPLTVLGKAPSAMASNGMTPAQLSATISPATPSSLLDGSGHELAHRQMPAVPQAVDEDRVIPEFMAGPSVPYPVAESSEFAPYLAAFTRDSYRNTGSRIKSPGQYDAYVRPYRGLDDAAFEKAVSEKPMEVQRGLRYLRWAEKQKDPEYLRWMDGVGRKLTPGLVQASPGDIPKEAMGERIFRTWQDIIAWLSGHRLGDYYKGLHGDKWRSRMEPTARKLIRDGRNTPSLAASYFSRLRSQGGSTGAPQPLMEDAPLERLRLPEADKVALKAAPAAAPMEFGFEPRADHILPRGPLTSAIIGVNPENGKVESDLIMRAAKILGKMR